MTSRILRRQIKRKQQQLAKHVEMLGAAFVRETGLSPRDVVLVTRQTDDGAIEQYFQTRTYDESLTALIEAAQKAAEAGNVEIAEALEKLQAKTVDEVRDGRPPDLQEHDGASKTVGEPV